LLTGLRQAIAAIPPPPFASSLEVGVDVVTLGARPVQGLNIAVRGSAKAWDIDRLDFRAPGATRVAVSGRIAATGVDAGFAGPVAIDSGVPDSLIAWLSGEKEPSYRLQKPLSIHGDAVIAQERIAFDRLQAEFHGHAIGGQIAVAAPGSGHAKLDATLHARELDLDGLAELTKSVDLAIDKWPEQAQLTVDVGKAKLFGQDVQPVAMQVSYNPQAISLKQLRIGENGKIAVEGAGGFDLTTSSGELKLAGSAPSLARLADMMASFAPSLGGRLRSVPDADTGGEARLTATINLDKPQKQRVGLRAALDLDAPQLKGRFKVTSALALADIKAIDLEKLVHSEGALTAKLTAPQGRDLVAVLGLGSAVAAGEGSGALDATITGAWSSPLQLKGKLLADGLDADIDGRADPWQAVRSGQFNVAVRRADIAPLLAGRRATNVPLPIALTSQVAMTGDKFVFDKVDATLAGSRLRGHFNATLGDVPALDGEIGADVIDLPAVLGVFTAAAVSDRTQPFGADPVSNWRGRVAFQSVRSAAVGNDVLALRGVVQNDGQTLAVNDVSGTVGGGELKGALALKRQDDNAALTAHLQLKGVNGTALHYRGLAMPAGRVAAQLELNGSGRSAAGLLGSLSGNGTVSVEALQIDGLNPAAFDAAMQASDSGAARGDAQLQKTIDGVLAAGAFNAAAADIRFTVKDGQIRVPGTTLVGTDARLGVSGGYDTNADQIDIRAALSASSADNSSAGRPEIEVMLFGSPDAPVRTVDVAALSGWLGLRAIEHETRRLEQLERSGGETQVNIPPSAPPSGDIMQEEPPLPRPRAIPRRRAPASPALPPAQANLPAESRAPALPPPTDVKPAPSIVRTPPRSHPPLVLTPNGARVSGSAN
jgi:large subunit ribosomal protein L24